MLLGLFLKLSGNLDHRVISNRGCSSHNCNFRSTLNFRSALFSLFWFVRGRLLNHRSARRALCFLRTYAVVLKQVLEQTNYVSLQLLNVLFSFPTIACCQLEHCVVLVVSCSLSSLSSRSAIPTVTQLQCGLSARCPGNSGDDSQEEKRSERAKARANQKTVTTGAGSANGVLNAAGTRREWQEHV